MQNGNAQANTEANSNAETTPSVADKMFPGEKPVETQAATEVKTETKPVETKVEEKPTETKAGETKVEDIPEVKLPENSMLKEADLKELTAFAKEQGLTNKQTQELLYKQNEKFTSFINEQVKAYKEKISQYENTIKNDKEIGGENFNQTITLAKRVTQKFGTENLLKEFDSTGFGSHPEVVRLLAKIGKAMSEDQLILPGEKRSEPKTIEERIYGKK